MDIRHNSPVGKETGELLDHIKEYVETKSKITQLTLLDKMSQAAGFALSGFIIGFLFFLFFIFIGIAAAYVLAEITGHTYMGFMIVAIIYLTAGLIFIWKKDRWIQKPLADKIISNYFDEDEEEED